MKCSAIMKLFTIGAVFLQNHAAQTQEVKNFTINNCIRANEILNQSIVKMGGLENITAISNITRTLSGVRTDKGQGLRPVPLTEKLPPIVNHPNVKSILDFKNLRVATFVNDTILGGQPLAFRSVVSNSTGYFIEDDKLIYRNYPSSSISTIRFSAFRRYPEGLILAALNRRETLRFLGITTYNKKDHNIVSFSDVDGALVTIFIDAETYLIAKQEWVTDNIILGDVTTAVVYGDWRTVNNINLPFSYVDLVGDAQLQRLNVKSIEINTVLDEKIFNAPNEYEEYAIQTAKFEKLSEGVYAIIDGTYNSLVVEFSDYILVIEAGNNVKATQLSIGEIKKQIPGKPIKYVVSTHFHFDHIGGIRSYIAEGTIIITTVDAKGIIESAAKIKHTLKPDALSTLNTKLNIEVVNSSRIFTDGNQVVVVYDIGPNPHAEHILIAYVPKAKIIYEADLLEIPIKGSYLSGKDTYEFYKKIKELKLEVAQILPTHGKLGSLKDLERALERKSL